MTVKSHLGNVLDAAITKIQSENLVKITNASQFKKAYEAKWPDSPFFSRATMKFWGDTLANFGFRTFPTYYSIYRKKTKPGIFHKEFFFDKETLQLIDYNEVERRGGIVQKVRYHD